MHLQYDHKMWHLTDGKISVSLSFLNWIKNEMIFHRISELMLTTLIQRFNKNIFYFKESLTEILQDISICGQRRGESYWNFTSRRVLLLTSYCLTSRRVLLKFYRISVVVAEGRGFQHLPRNPANVNALKKHVRSLLLHKNWKHLLHFALFLALFCFAFSPMCRERNFHGLCSF